MRGDSGHGYVRVDWFTPDAMPTWGDGRLFLLGTQGTIEVRKYTEIGRDPPSRQPLPGERYRESIRRRLGIWTPLLRASDRRCPRTHRDGDDPRSRLPDDGGRALGPAAGRDDRRCERRPSMIRVAIVGAGIGREHLAAYRRLGDRFEVTTLCDLDTGRAEQVIAEAGAEGVTIGASVDGALAAMSTSSTSACLPNSISIRASPRCAAASTWCARSRSRCRSPRSIGSSAPPPTPTAWSRRSFSIATASAPPSSERSRQPGCSANRSPGASRPTGTGADGTTTSTGAAPGRPREAGRCSDTQSMFMTWPRRCSVRSARCSPGSTRE